jgi:chemotaxis protein MotB
MIHTSSLSPGIDRQLPIEDEPEERGIPEWVVTFGDLMSLLLTFFIMLVSLSEIKEEETYQALVDSMRRQFGYTRSVDALTPGDSRPRTTDYRVLATVGRAKTKDTARGGVPQKAPSGEDPKVRIVRPGHRTAVGSVIFFAMGSDQLDAEAEQTLANVAAQLRGRPQKIEVRGHVTAEYATRTEGSDEAVALGFRRAAAVRRILIQQERIDPARIRVCSAAANEPISRTEHGSPLERDCRVEVFLLDETVDPRRGTDRSMPKATEPIPPVDTETHR